MAQAPTQVHHHVYPHPHVPSTPSVSLPGTPVHSIQTVRRRIAGHHGPLTKILVANRGVRPSSSAVLCPCLCLRNLCLCLPLHPPTVLPTQRKRKMEHGKYKIVVWLHVYTIAISRKSRFAFSERHMNWRCIQWLYTHTKIDSLLIDKRYVSCCDEISFFSPN